MGCVYIAVDLQALTVLFVVLAVGGLTGKKHNPPNNRIAPIVQFRVDWIVMFELKEDLCQKVEVLE